MRIIQSIAALQRALARWRREGMTVGLVPTMGYFHEGHLSLMRRARRDCGRVVVSVFVNPLQFGPREDIKKYPRDLKRDARLADKAGADLLFAPTAEEFYGRDHATLVTVGRLSEPLCGRSRPGHFRGVATVVAKLFNLIRPDRAYFGRKDYQQALVIKQMTKDLGYDISIRVLPTVREPNGLARSSRNAYLTPDEKKRSAGIYRSLRETERLFRAGERRAGILERFLKKRLADLFGRGSVIYAEIRDARTLSRIRRLRQPSVAACAVKVGKARLIDNIILKG